MDEPAFPSDGKWGNGIPEKGMTLRDYFAAKAPDMPAWWFESWETNERNKAKKKDTYIMRGRLEALTEWRFSFADAMLKARGKAEGTEGK